MLKTYILRVQNPHKSQFLTKQFTWKRVRLIGKSEKEKSNSITNFSETFQETKLRDYTFDQPHNLFEKKKQMKRSHFPIRTVSPCYKTIHENQPTEQQLKSTNPPKPTSGECQSHPSETVTKRTSPTSHTSNSVNPT